MTDAERLAELRRCVVSMFVGFDEADVAFHPAVITEAWRIAELLQIDTATVPTEARQLRAAATDLGKGLHSE